MLDFEGNSAADVLRITTPVTEDSRATGRALFSPGDRALVSFDHGGKHYQMETEVMETGLDAVCIRPTSQIHGEAGQQVSVIDFSAGGALLQGSRKLTEFLLDRKVDRDELSSDNPAHRDIFRSLERRLVKLTFQPKLHFPEIGRRFQPRVPAKICVLAKIVRSQFVACKGKEVVQHGVRFVYDEQDDEGMDCWREIKKGHGNRHFNEIHTKLGRLSGFLERESRDKGLLGVTQEISGDRVAFAVEKATASGRKRRVIS